VLAIILFAAFSTNPVDIVRTAVELSQKTDDLRQRYSFTQETVQRSPGKTSSKTYEITFSEGKQYKKLIRHDGKAVEEKAELNDRGDKQRDEMLGELTKAFEYTLAHDEVIDGFPCWQLHVKPKAGYKPPSFRLSFLTQMEGKVWISKDHNRLVRLDAKTTGPGSFGWGLLKLAPGTQIYLEQSRIDGDVWMPRKLKISYEARVIFKSTKGEIETTSWDFKRVNPGT